jgi:hypothetical protein
MVKKIFKKKWSFESIEKLVKGFIDSDNKKGTGVEPADPNSPSWFKYVAILTAGLAGLAGFLVVRSGTLTNQAIFQSNQAILAQAQASDSWAEYQADSIKARIVETQLLPSSPISATDRAALAKEDEDLRSRQPQSKQAATDQTALRDKHIQATQKLTKEKGLLEYASLAVQFGIVLASVAAMVKKPFVLHLGILAGIGGALITAWAMLEGLIP